MGLADVEEAFSGNLVVHRFKVQDSAIAEAILERLRSHGYGCFRIKYREESTLSRVKAVRVNKNEPDCF